MSGTTCPQRHGSTVAAKLTPEEPPRPRREDRLYADLKVQSLIDLAPDQRYKTIMAMSADEQFAFAESLRGGKGQDFLAGLDPKQKETLQAMKIRNPSLRTNWPRQTPACHLQRSQLEEVMADFWFNHSTFSPTKAPTHPDHNYEQDVIRRTL